MLDQPSPSRDTRAMAIALAAKGLPVFPVKYNGKLPEVDSNGKSLCKKASVHPEEVYALFSDAHGESRQCNIGIKCGNGLVAIDIDNKVGKVEGALPPLEILNILIGRLGPLPKTWTARTQNDGWHLFFRVPEGCHVPRKLGGLCGVANVDVIGDSNGDPFYVVAAGSIGENGEYRWGNGRSPDNLGCADLPEPWVEALSAPKPKPPLSDCATVEAVCALDTPAAIDEAINYLQRAAPAIEGSGGLKQTMVIANYCMDLGVSPAETAELMLEHWNERNAPAWDPDELTKLVVGLPRSRQNPIGYRSVWATFKPAEVSPGSEGPRAANDDAPGPQPSPESKAQRSTSFSLDDAYDRALDLGGKPLVANWLEQGGFSVMYGPPGDGKTFAAINLTLSISAGLSWAGEATEQGLVLYFALEGGSRQIQRRLRAAVIRMGLPRRLPFVCISGGLDLANGKAGTARVLELIRENEGKFGRKCVLVVIDTLARAMCGADENSAPEMQAFIANVDRIRGMGAGPHVMVVHHPGKDTSKGLRGHSSLHGATNTEIKVEGGEIRSMRQKDLEEGRSLCYKIVNVDLGPSPDGGKSIAAGFAVITPPNWTAQDPPTAAEGELLDDLEMAIAQSTGDGPPAGVTWGTWVEVARGRGGSRSTERSRLLHTRAALIRKRLIKVFGENQTL